MWYTLSMGITNSKSCVLDAFAEVLNLYGVSKNSLIRAIGHDGSEEGVNTQEIITALIGMGFACTPIERDPHRENPETHVVSPIIFPGGAQNRWHDLVDNVRTGVAYGFKEGRTVPHALPWIDGQLVDGSLRPFHIYMLWKVDQVE